MLDQFVRLRDGDPFFYEARLEGNPWMLDDVKSLSFADIIKANRYLTDMSQQDVLNRVWAEYFGDAKPATTTVQVVALATDPRCLIEIDATAIID